MGHSRKYNVAVVGATGNTGMKTLQILEERDFPAGNVTAIASERSIGKSLFFGDGEIPVRKFEDVDFSRIDITFFCAGGGVSRRYAESVTKSDCVVIDKTSYFRLNPKVPLIVPEINSAQLAEGALLGIVSNPNCVAIPLAMTLKALSAVSQVKRAVVSTYQSVSGAGRLGVDELYSQTKSIVAAGAVKPDVFSKQIAFNVIPAIGDFYQSGTTDEEDKISAEVRKILKADVKVAVTCVRVPVFVGHSMSVAAEFSAPVAENNARRAFESFEGVLVVDRRGEKGVFATPLDVQGEDGVYVSRIRADPTTPAGLLYWIAADNLRKGAALNSVQIAELMISLDPSLKLFQRR
ncbi:MAG: aspartate-semialdehyde dehydrogenase [Holosporaceae bacterium]|jgi:aspartate-semialdehyde dehydrogenase|nr:aspartate-semialdehyde dehydrogenase [Holosporaceae bacterium]